MSAPVLPTKFECASYDDDDQRRCMAWSKLIQYANLTPICVHFRNTCRANCRHMVNIVLKYNLHNVRINFNNAPRRRCVISVWHFAINLFIHFATYLRNGHRWQGDKVLECNCRTMSAICRCLHCVKFDDGLMGVTGSVLTGVGKCRDT